jgi:DNA gyrase/topoisomerase IV subunit A
MAPREETPDSLSEREMAERRLRLIDAYLLAAARKEEVMRVVAEADDPERARQAVAELLSIKEIDAMGVLDLRLARFTHREVAGHQTERDSLLAHLETLNRGQ